jgi:sugar phosphate isomerase/epimerase
MPYDIILNNTDPKLVKMEMDLFWTVKGRQDPLTYFNRFPGRFCLVHVKDMKQNGEMTEVGSGSIDFKKIFAQSEKAGIQHYFVEHDQPKDPLESIKASYEYLRKLRY